MRTRPPAGPRRGAILVAVLLLVPLLGAAQPASASTVDQLRQQRRAVQQRRATQASQINLLKASNQQVSQALSTLDANRRTQQAAVETARQRSAAEAARAVQAKEAEDRTAATLTGLRNSVRRLAVQEYMRGSTPEVDVTPDPSSPMETARRRTLLSAAVGTSSEMADRLRSAQQDLEVERQSAQKAAADAAAEQRRVESRLAELETATKQQQAFADQVESQLEQKLAEADALASIDASYAAKITTEQAAIARQLRATAPSAGSSGAGRAAPSAVRRSGSVSLTTVRGITVASSIGDNLAALLNAADSAGISFGGGGYRDPAAQEQTRRNNCGSSDYDVYQKPASQCSPPTARPGSSMHEQGLAIDFTVNGSILTRGSAGSRWLQGNASRFGFYNLPSEAWHWSTNGN